MRFLKRIKLTLHIWWETKEHGYTFNDCWIEADDILGRTDPWNKWEEECRRNREHDSDN